MKNDFPGIGVLVFLFSLTLILSLLSIAEPALPKAVSGSSQPVEEDVIRESGIFLDCSTILNRETESSGEAPVGRKFPAVQSVLFLGLNQFSGKDPDLKSSINLLLSTKDLSVNFHQLRI